jgi:hypothetical protein
MLMGFPIDSSIIQWKASETTLSELAAVVQGEARTQWRPLDSTGIMVLGSGGRYQPMPISADEPRVY